MEAYDLVLSEAAAMRMVAASRAEQRRLAAVLDEVKTAPFRAGDLQERDALGRVHEVLIVGEWLVTYWSDHAAREVRVVRVERVED